MGSQDSPQYTITFKGYTSSTNVPLSSLRPHDPTAPIPVPVKRAAEPTEREKEKKKRKGEKWMASQKERADEARGKQNAWEKFGKKAHKKGIHIAGLEGKSVFRTSDSPYGELRHAASEVSEGWRAGVEGRRAGQRKKHSGWKGGTGQRRKENAGNRTAC